MAPNGKYAHDSCGNSTAICYLRAYPGNTLMHMLLMRGFDVSLILRKTPLSSGSKG